MSDRASAGCPSSTSGDHVLNRSEHASLCGQRRGLSLAGQWPDETPAPAPGVHPGNPEVHQLGACLRQHDVGRLQIAMDDARAMRFVERIGDVDRVRHRFVERQRSISQPRGQRFSLDQFHHQEVDAVVLADVVQRADVRMVQCGDGLGFALEARTELRVGQRVSVDRTLIATVRSRRVSRALYTSPIPPAPSGERISYGPRRAPMDSPMAPPILI